MENVQAVIGEVAALVAVLALVVAMGVLADLFGPRRRSWLEDAGRPAPQTPEEWERESARSAARSATRRQERG